MKLSHTFLISLLCGVIFFIGSVKSTEEAKKTDGKNQKRPDDPDLSSMSPHEDEEGHHDDDFDHEAVTGSHSAAEEFKELSPEESQKRLGVLITRMDKDKDGCVDREELTNWLVDSFRNLDIENSREKFGENDADKDGKVSWNEYLKHTYGSGEKEIKEMEKEKTQDMIHFHAMIADEKVKFEAADVNKDGSLELNEYVAFIHPQNFPHMTDYEINRTLFDFDKNKDGFVDSKEFIYEADFMDNETKLAEQKHFKEFDKNGDGKLDRNELVAWVMPGHISTAESEVSHLYAETDANKDGKLCRDEILKQYELWVGSHATNYGAHLDNMKKDEL